MLAGDASQNILDLYAKSGEVAVSQKSDASPVTDADHASHRLICESLTSLTPAIPVLSEESTLEQLIGRRDWPCCWMIDPSMAPVNFWRERVNSLSTSP